FGSPSMTLDLKAMVQKFIAAGAVLDSVDVAGNRPVNAEESLYRMSKPTGGEVIAAGNDIADALTRLAATHEVVYLLGFHPRGRATGAIDVGVSGIPRTSVVDFRTGYAAPPARGELDALQLADIVLNDVPQRGLTADVAVDVHDGVADVLM